MRLQLDSKIFLFSIPPFVMVMAVIGTISILHEIANDRALFSTKLLNYTSLLESGALSFESISNKEGLEALLREEIVTSELILRDYSVPYSSNPLDSSDSLDQSLVAQSFEGGSSLLLRERNSYTYIAPIVHDGNTIGVLRITFRNANSNSRILNYITLILLLNLFGLIVSFLLIRFLIRNNISKHLSALMVGSKEVASGNLDYFVQRETNDELGDLANLFNTMTASLKTSISSLKNKNDELENFFKVTVGRELRMAELKKKLEQSEEEPEHY